MRLNCYCFRENYTFVPMKPHHLILFLLFSVLAACHSSTHDMKQVAQDALENARTLGQKYPDLDEDEKKSFILSHFKVSRQEEADYLGTTVNMVDKLRGRVRKKMAENA